MAWGRLRPLTPHLQNITLDKPEISFGRAQSCDVSMPNMPSYSGKHATVTRRGDVRNPLQTLSRPLTRSVVELLVWLLIEIPLASLSLSLSLSHTHTTHARTHTLSLSLCCRWCC